MARTVSSLVEEGTTSNPTLKWAQDTVEHLISTEHWFCSEQDADLPELVRVLLVSLPAIDMDMCARLWPGVRTCCSTCLSCIMGFHQMQERMEQRDCPVMGEAMMLQAVERLQCSLHLACRDLRNSAADGAQVSMEGILAFLEVLAVWRLLGDQVLSDKTVAFVHAMLDLQCDMDVSEHLPGMFALAAHHDERVRSFVQTHMLSRLPKVVSKEDIEGIPNIWSLVDTWVMTLACGTCEGMHPLLPGRQAYQQQEPYLMTGMGVLLGVCERDSMLALVKRHPDMRSLIIQRAAAICRPGYEVVGACSALQALTTVLKGVGGTFWSQMSAHGSPMDWNVASVTNVLTDGLLRVRERAAYLTDLTCKVINALVQSLVLPAGRIVPELEALVFEKLHALLTRVCRGITLLRDVPPEARRQRVHLVQRSVWQVLLSLAQQRVCVSTFAAAFMEFLHGALSQAQPFANHLPQRLLMTVAWADAQHVLSSCGMIISIPQHLGVSPRPPNAHAACPAMWQLLPLLATDTWGLHAALELTAAVAVVLNSAANSIRSNTALTVTPGHFNGSDFAAARSRQEFTPGQQLLAQLQAALEQLLQYAALSPEPLRQLILSASPRQPGVQQPPASDALSQLLALQWTSHAALCSMAQRVLCSLAATAGEPELQDALLLLLKGPDTAAVLCSALQERLQQTSTITVQQLCSHEGSGMEALFEFCASFFSSAADIPDAPQSAISTLADSAWGLVVDLLRACIQDVRSVGGNGASHAQLHPREINAVLISIVRAMSVVWVTHAHKLAAPAQPPAQLRQNLSFLEPFLAVCSTFPRMPSALREVWEAGLMAMTSELSQPAPWGTSVEQQAVLAVSEYSVPNAVKEHLSKLLGRASPGNVARMQVSNAIQDLPSRDFIDLTQTTKSCADVRVLSNKTGAAVLHTPDRKSTNGKKLSTSPLLTAWKKAQLRADISDGAAGTSTQQTGQQHGEVGVTPIRANGMQPLNFSRTGGAKVAVASTAAPKKAHVPVATLYERRGLKHLPPQRAAAAAAEARAGGLAHTSSAATPVATVSSAAPVGQKRGALRPPQQPASMQKKPRLRDIVNCEGDTDEEEEDGSDSEMLADKRRKLHARKLVPGVSHAQFSRQRSGANTLDAKPVVSRPAPPRHQPEPPTLPAQPSKLPPPNAATPPVLTSQLIERAAQSLKAAHETSKKIKLAPLPSFGGKAAGSRLYSAAKSAPPKTDLTHRSSEKGFTRNLLAMSFQDFKRSSAVIKKLPPSFSNLRKYVESFEQLLMLEIQAQVAGNISEGAMMASVGCTITDVLRREEFWEVTAAVSSSDSPQALRNEDLVAVRVSHSGGVGVNEDDDWKSDNSRLALIVQSNMSAEQRQPTVTFFINLKSFKNNRMDLHALHKVIRKGSRLSMTHMLSVVPHLREVRALVNVHNLPRPLLQSLLQPSPPDDQEALTRKSQDRLPQKLKGYLTQSFNKTQCDAISKACFHQKTSINMSMIQGPPGTGKTSVICGIIACLLHGNTFKRGAVNERPSDAIGQGIKANSVPAKRVLVCAQSNAAIDELLSRLSARGLATGTHTTRAVSMLRLGSYESAHPAALQFHIDHVVDGLAPGKDKVPGGGELAQLRSALLKVVTKISNLKQAKKAKDVDQVEKLESRRRLLEARISQCGETTNVRMQRATRDERRSALRCAEVVVATLSAAGGDLSMLLTGGGRGGGKAREMALRFDAVIIDEAAQAIEPATLIPMHVLDPVKGQLVLVGDPQQLPPTVLSKAACAGLSQSLFERLQRGGAEATLLQFQYRMHPDISAFPSAFFYNKNLLDGTTANGKRADFHQKACLAPLVFFDVECGRQERSYRGSSLMNHEEAKLAFTLLNYLFHQHVPEDIGTVGVITPYKAQVQFIKQRLKSDLRNFAEVSAFVEVSTVDAFQGREADVIILSCVRAPWHSNIGGSASTSNVGFLKDVRRMNVALTRARRSLWVLGHVESLVISHPWRALAEHAAKERRLYQALPKYSDLLRVDRPKLARLPKNS